MFRIFLDLVSISVGRVTNNLTFKIRKTVEAAEKIKIRIIKLNQAIMLFSIAYHLVCQKLSSAYFPENLLL